MFLACVRVCEQRIVIEMLYKTIRETVKLVPSVKMSPFDQMTDKFDVVK